MVLTLPLVYVTLALVLLAFKLFRKKRDPRFPPGPPPVPLIGNILQIGSQPQKAFLKWAEQYGNVFSFKIGTLDVIVLNESNIIKDVFADPRSAGRTPNEIFTSISNGYYGIAIREGEHWEQQRRFTLKTLRDLGYAKTSMEGIILEEINSMLKFLEKRVNKPITGNHIFSGSVVNALWSIISGERHDWDGRVTPKILEALEETISAINFTTKSGLMFAPFLRHIAPGYFGWTRWINSIANLFSVTNQSVTKHASKLDSDSPQDLIDYYLIEMQNETDPNSSFYKETGDKNLQAVILDLFVAGSATTSDTLSWLMLHLAHNQNVVTKLQQEVDMVLGRSRQPSAADRQNLPYTTAVILEILRRTSVVNSGIPHKMLEDAVINGYFFPKDTTVISNIYRANNDPKVWGDPHNFRPERFLSEDGSTVIRNDALIPFSSGKRVCLGESLARDTLFMFLVCIVQKFDINPASGSNPDQWKNTEPTNKMLNEPEHFEVIFSLRKQ